MKVKSKVNKKLYNRLSTMALPEFNCNEPNVCTNAKQQNEPLQEIHFEISFIFRAKKVIIIPFLGKLTRQCMSLHINIRKFDHFQNNKMQFQQLAN